MSKARGCLLLALPLVAACEAEPRGPSRAESTALAAASVRAAPPLSVVAPPASVRPVNPGSCRIVAASGQAMLGADPLAVGTLLDGSAWVSLEQGARLTLKHVESGRELSLSGPARFRACHRGVEQLLLARGTVTTTAGAGARPGAEVLLATPLAALRYTDAELSLTVDERSLAVTLRVGRAELEPSAALPGVARQTLAARKEQRWSSGSSDASALMAACGRAAGLASAAAQRVAERSSAEPLGKRAREHVRARRAARTSCAVAAAAAGLAADPQASAGLAAEAQKWETLWETIPRSPGRQPSEK